VNHPLAALHNIEHHWRAGYTDRQRQFHAQIRQHFL
jgi:hypothetical protein